MPDWRRWCNLHSQRVWSSHWEGCLPISFGPSWPPTSPSSHWKSLPSRHIAFGEEGLHTHSPQGCILTLCCWKGDGKASEPQDYTWILAEQVWFACDLPLRWPSIWNCLPLGWPSFAINSVGSVRKLTEIGTFVPVISCQCFLTEIGRVPGLKVESEANWLAFAWLKSQR